MLRLRPQLAPGMAAVLALSASAASVRAQDVWVEPQPPCNIRPGDRLVNDGMIHLKVGVESEFPEQREARFDQAYEVLVRAISQRDQGDNPAAWYYLARYFVYRGDGVGADSSFRKAVALAPECEDDASQYRLKLQPDVLAQALQSWQEGQHERAMALFSAARGLDPSDANTPFFMSEVFSSTGELDSAAAYIEIGNRLAGDNPEFARRRQRAMLELARALESRGAGEPALRRIDAVRLSRDSALRNIQRDSTMLARLIEEWAGKNLRPEVAQAVQRDSTALETRLAAARARRDEIAPTMNAESTAVDAAMGPALEAYREYLEAFPEDVTTALRVLRLASTAGSSAMMSTLIELVTSAEEFDQGNVVQTGIALFRSGHLEETVGLLEAALSRNPYHATALLIASTALYTLGDAERALELTQRLISLDPLNPQAVRMLAAAWDLNGQRDSARAYLEAARGGMGWGVTVTQFVPTEGATVLNGTVTNISGAPLEATTLEFEFLRSDGAVVGAASVEVPSLQPNQQHSIALRVAQGGAAGWRYNRR